MQFYGAPVFIGINLIGVVHVSVCYVENILFKVSLRKLCVLNGVTTLSSFLSNLTSLNHKKLL